MKFPDDAPLMMSDTLGALYDLQTADDFVVAAMQHIPPLVDSELTSFNEVNYARRRMVTIIDNSRAQQIFSERGDRFMQLMHQNPLIAHYAQTTAGPLKISDFIAPDEFFRQDIHREFYAPIGANFQMALVLPLEADVIVAFAFHRRERDFSERDRAVLAFLQPHVTRAYRNALLHTETLGRIGAREAMLSALGAGWVDLDEDFRVVRAARSSVDALTSFFEVSAMDASRLPPDLEAWVRRNAAEMPAGVAAAPFVSERLGERLVVRLVPGSDSARIGLVMERSGTSGDPQQLQALGLSERQAEVLYWVSLGKSNADIAIILRLSVRTVENHVQGILRSLDVGNRTAAAILARSALTSANKFPRSTE